MRCFAFTAVFTGGCLPWAKNARFMDTSRYCGSHGAQAKENPAQWPGVVSFGLCCGLNLHRLWKFNSALGWASEVHRLKVVLCWAAAPVLS